VPPIVLLVSKWRAVQHQKADALATPDLHAPTRQRPIPLYYALTTSQAVRRCWQRQIARGSLDPAGYVARGKALIRHALARLLKKTAPSLMPAARSSLLHPAAHPHGSLTTADAPLINAETTVQTTGATS
jgi:hypothetical protein